MTVQTGEDTVHGLIERLVLRSPDATAVECDGDRLSFEQLWRRSAVVAARIREIPGHRTGDLLATLFPRGIEGIVAQLGIWRAGCAYLPLDPALPKGRLDAVLADARPRAVLTSRDIDRRAAHGVPVVRVAAEDPGPGPDLPPVAETEIAPAYVIYTSGSTGTPKGVEVGHRSLVRLVAWHGQRYRTRAGVRVAAFAGLGFDASVWETWATLANGATLVLPATVLPADLGQISEFLERHAIEQCFLSTPLAEQMFLLGECPASLKVLTTGGDRLRIHPPGDFTAAVFNHYGPTEATVVTTASADLRTCERTGLPVIGRPIDPARVQLVDADGEEITDSKTDGELLIGGGILALGYRHDETLNSERFVHGDDGSRWYRSGDICRWNESGELEFVGRQDGQVKISGYRIELAEIEQVMLRTASVDQAAAVVRRTEDGDTILAFYCGAAEEGDIRAGLRENLPGYMLPAVIRRIERMPLNSTGGKIDRNALLSEHPDDRREAGEPTAPRSTRERVSDIWSSMLGCTVGESDNFFDVGGHSLSAARITGRVRKEFGIAIGLGAILNNPVLTDYADRVDELLRGGK
ncbi:non-ribosomal peptide synthetase [Streptomyces macrosporus]|uniref:non-ribosomal peptide synthetase n=1 Tax=Streptomyces macrosporus TaxID=44032 RepID=UPI0031DA00CA